MIARVWQRLYEDFFMPSRLDVYRQLLETALASGYAATTIGAFWKRLQQGPLDPAARHLIIRHDIDTDIETARQTAQIEQSLGVPASYFFRQSTFDVSLARAVPEAGYHYEELATVAKQLGLKTRAAALDAVPQARVLFRENLRAFRQATGLPLTIAAAHGDFVNRRLGVTSCVVLDDPALRAELGIELEVYDDVFMRHVTSRHADAAYPRFWEPTPPEPALARGEPVVYLLTHPRHWCARPWVNFKDNARRVWEGCAYACR